MKRVLIYSGLLLAGMGVAQGSLLNPWQPWIHAVTMVCLSYIMLEVGLEFSADMGHVSQYAADFWVAAAAAALPWILCALYFIGVLHTPAKEAGLVGLFAAATSAGVLFTMLAAAGLSRTWVFKKARVLAIFDDLVTVLLIIPLQILFAGFHWKFVGTSLISVGLLAMAWRWLNHLFWPVRKPWLLLYGAGVTLASWFCEHRLHLHLGVLLPAFVLGCILHHQGTLKEGDDPHSGLDQGIKALFLFLVGCSLPPVAMNGMPIGTALLHVLALTILSNAGKCVPFFLYRQEAAWNERLALSVAMFPRGEVGAGILLVALSYGIQGLPVMLGSLSLALNLLMTGVFIRVVAALSPGYRFTNPHSRR
ncbi:MAG: hypothetical protein A2992_02940 [Elusimicrobia bacterium RIFCSPLOWO2_01_FULL_59_12]|nr:MAG: hypothetical protein A2992_02940 [Elusimicrobia bacterium RIFCSPLOWO2_01_FULL_59_12]